MQQGIVGPKPLPQHYCGLSMWLHSRLVLLTTGRSFS